MECVVKKFFNTKAMGFIVIVSVWIHVLLLLALFFWTYSREQPGWANCCPSTSTKIKRSTITQINQSEFCEKLNTVRLGVALQEYNEKKFALRKIWEAFPYPSSALVTRFRIDRNTPRISSQRKHFFSRSQ